MPSSNSRCTSFRSGHQSKAHSGRQSKAATKPRTTDRPLDVLRPGMSLAAVNRLLLSTLRFCLDQYHLVHRGTKKDVARRLHCHLQALPQGKSTGHASSSASSSDDEDDVHSSASEDEIENHSSSEAATLSDAESDSEPDDGSNEESEDVTDEPDRASKPEHEESATKRQCSRKSKSLLTTDQQQALQDTVAKAIGDSLHSHRRKRHCRHSRPKSSSPSLFLLGLSRHQPTLPPPQEKEMSPHKPV